MEKLLFLAHRIPYPPNKGDKIRSFHLLRHLARTHRIYLGAFIDDPADRAHAPVLESLCEAVHLAELRPRSRRLWSLSGLLTGEALSLPYYRHPGMRRWVERVLEAHAIDRVLVYSSQVAQYVQGARWAGLRRIADFVDVDSEKWRQYGARRAWPMSWLYAREGERLLAFERAVAAEFDATTFVTEEEAALFRGLAPEAGARVRVVANGVDTDYFSPERRYPDPYAPGGPVLVFTGAMDYWANIDAVTWFAESVFPRVRRSLPEARLYVVGARPSPAVRKLQAQPGIFVTGAVEDVRPYLAHARLAVAPLRVARGIQNKVLEAMAMAKPIVATRAATEGLLPGAPLNPVADGDAEALAERALRLLSEPGGAASGAPGRDWVVRHCAWGRSFEQHARLLGTPPAGGHGAGRADPTLNTLKRLEEGVS